MFKVGNKLTVAAQYTITEQMSKSSDRNFIMKKEYLPFALGGVVTKWAALAEH